MSKTASVWALEVRQEYADLAEARIKLLENSLPAKPALHEALLNKNERMMAVVSEKLTVIHHLSKIVGLAEDGKLSIHIPELNINIDLEWSKDDSRTNPKEATETKAKA